MTYTEKTCATPQARKQPIPTAESIIDDIVAYDDPQNLRDNLREMMDAYFMFDQMADPDEKRAVFNTYQLLNAALKKMEHFNPRR